MTPDQLRAAIASARERAAAYGVDPRDLASYLSGLVVGAYSGPLDALNLWCSLAPRGNAFAASGDVCDCAEAVVARLWPEGDGDGLDAADYAEVARSAAEVLLEHFPSGEGGPSLEVVLGDLPSYVNNLAIRVKRVEGECDAAEQTVGRPGEILRATADALKGPPPALSAHSWHDLPEVAARLRADLAAAQPVLALDAIRRGPAALVCPDCGASWSSDVPTCPGCGRRDGAPDRDLCARCGKLALDHDCEAPR